MKVRFDFFLNKQFSSVEKTIFRLVLNGMYNILDIRKLLWILSDQVVAEAVKNLVNRQILNVSSSEGIIQLSEPIDSLIHECHYNNYDLQIPKELAPDSHLIISIEGENSRYLKTAILKTILPKVNLEFLNNSIDFIICKVGDEGENRS